jgi:hypothetical protein
MPFCFYKGMFNGKCPGCNIDVGKLARWLRYGIELDFSDEEMIIIGKLERAYRARRVAG